MAYSKRYLIQLGTIIACCLAGSPSIPAQSQTSDGDGFRLLSGVTETDISDICYDLKGTQIKVVARPGAPSENHPMPQGGVLHLYREVQVPDTTTNPPTIKVVKQPMADVAISGIKPPLLIVLNLSPPGSAMPLFGTCANYSRNRIPQNTAYFLNLSHYKIATRFSENEFTLAPGAQKISSYKIKERGELLVIKMASSTDGITWKSMEDGRLMMSLDVRETIIYCDDQAKTGEIKGGRYLLLTDYSKPLNTP